MSSQNNEHIYITDDTDDTDDEEGEFLENEIDNIISSQKSQYEDSKQSGKEIITINKQLKWINYNLMELCKEKEKIINDLKKRITNKKGKIKILNQQIKEKDKEIESLKQENITYKKEFSKFKEEKDAEIKDLKDAKIKDLKDTEIENLREKNRILSNQLEAIKICGGKLEDKHLGVEIIGHFINGDLNLAMPFLFKGPYVKEQYFCFSGSKLEKFFNFLLNSKKIKFSKEDFSKMNEVRSKKNRLSIFSSNTDKGFVFDKNFVYQGEIDGYGDPYGSGIMLKSTGKVIEGNYSNKEWFKFEEEEEKEEWGRELI
ncbi:hypothetical protein BCR32DRAFT_265120 [Anaeromyces robustus]|uniref:Uncharacterized protein n=1 Tax=Anaeromyces robustus TaxID=1754192 RepID=A0A1Y1XKS5_9FUNG|nr:hypothetical protein BCR32DRAFT_265120 [Anaeromyces robustus]|eukprot:ORX86303.1 hypothetical protein BCR32DRAFT_265120 [Anaeromyces robustus]